MITHLHQKFICFVQCRMAHLIEIQQLFLQCNLNRIKSLWKRKEHFGAHLHQSSSFVQRFFFFAFNIRLGSSFFVPIPACSCISFCPFFFSFFHDCSGPMKCTKYIQGIACLICRKRTHWMWFNIYGRKKSKKPKKNEHNENSFENKIE